MKAEFIQNSYYIKGQACHLDRIVRVVGKGSSIFTLRIRLRSFHSGSPGSYAIAEFWTGQNGWAEVLNWDIQDLYCKDACYLNTEGRKSSGITPYDLLETDAKYLIKKALEVLEA